jgi:hypothetical protein
MSFSTSNEVRFSYCKQTWENKPFFLRIAHKPQFQFIDVAINVYVYVSKFYITNRESKHIYLEPQGKSVGPNHLILRHEITVYMMPIMTSAVIKMLFVIGITS